MSTGRDGRPLRLAVLASGNGSNLQAVIDACAAPRFGARVVAVFSDKPEAFALERARAAGIKAVALPFSKGQARGDYDAALAGEVAALEPDLIFLLGWMRLLSGSFLSRFPGGVVNLHPALPGTFPGTHAVERALDAYHSGALDRTGVMTHFVPDEGVDSGPVILAAEVPIHPDDTLATLEARVHVAEHRLIVDTVKRLIDKYGPRRPGSPEKDKKAIKNVEQQ